MIAHSQVDPIYRIETGELSLGDIEQEIDSLMVRKKRLAETLTDLEQKAQRFYDKAEKLE